MRPLLAAAVAAALTAAPAGAAPRPVCDLLKDDRHDTYLWNGTVWGAGEDRFDIVSADVASDDRTLTAVVRIADLRAGSGPAAAGVTYRVGFGRPGTTWDTFLYASVGPAGTTFGLAAYVYTDPTTLVPDGAKVTGVVDEARGEVRMSVPLDALRRYYRLDRGSALRVGGAHAARGTGSGNGTSAELYGDGVDADHATGPVTYVLGTPSCVPVGR